MGPGDSIGVGLSALICGAQTYYAVDVQQYATVERSLEVFEDLVRLVQESANQLLLVMDPGWVLAV